MIGLALAYFMFRKNKKGLISTILEPLIGEKLANGWLGKLVDILAVFQGAITCSILKQLDCNLLTFAAGETLYSKGGDSGWNSSAVVPRCVPS